MTPEELARIPFSRGPANATIAFVGEAPGDHEAADPNLRPFIGPSGQLLMKMMQEVGLDPDTVYFTNVIKEKPEEKEINAWIKAHKDRYSIYSSLLSTELSSLPKLQLIVPVGATALTAITSKNSIDSWRGSILSATMPGIRGKKCVAIIHPAAILRMWLYKPSTVLDLQRIKEEAEFSAIKLPQRTFILRPSFEEVLDEIEMWRKSKEPLSIDLETLPRPQRIASFQGSISPQRAMAILFQHKDGRNCWPEDQELIIWKALSQLLNSCGKRIIGQNILTFDLFMLAVYGFDLQALLRNVWLDTMEAFECLEPELPRGLDFLTSVYTKEPYYKAEGKEWETRQGEDEFLVYGCKDVAVVAEIAPQLHQELIEEGLLEFYYERFQKMADARLKMSLRGLLIDEAKRKELETKFTRDIVIEQAKLNVLVGENINVESHKQMKDLLYTKMKLPLQWKDGKITCNEDALLTLSARHPSEMFKHVLVIRNKRTLFSNNVKARKDSDGRIRCSFGFTETGRFRSYACPLGSGGNLQNWTPEMRVMVVPDPGMVLVEGDLSQADARVVAYAGHIKYMIEVFEQNRDIHSETASLIFENLLARYVVKQIVHACNYDIHAPTFAKRYNRGAADNDMPLTSVQDAAKYLAFYHQKVPELRANYHAWIQDQLCTTKTLFNPFGRRMRFHDRIGQGLFRAGYAWYAQSTVADVTNIILAAIYRVLDILLQVHDSLLVQCKPTDVTNVIKLMRLANPTFNVRGTALRIPLEFKISDRSWYHMQEVKEPVAT